MSRLLRRFCAAGLLGLLSRLIRINYRVVFAGENPGLERNCTNMFRVRQNKDLN